MTAFNVVRFTVKPGMEQKFLDAHAPGKLAWPGLAKGHIINTGKGSYCLIGEWPDAETLAAARPAMIALLDSFRHLLEPGPAGVTNAVSGEVVLTLA